MQTAQNEKLLETVEIMKAIEISNISFATNRFNGTTIIGTLTNNSLKTASNLKITASIYEESALVNVSNEWLSSIKIIEPSQSVNFSFDAKLEEGKDLSAYKVELIASDLNVI